jgi:hypothetical protein
MRHGSRRSSTIECEEKARESRWIHTWDVLNDLSMVLDNSGGRRHCSGLALLSAGSRKGQQQRLQDGRIRCDWSERGESRWRVSTINLESQKEQCSRAMMTAGGDGAKARTMRADEGSKEDSNRG